jgi:RNA polymerase sigma-70 factor (ECF subfamily)
MNFVHGGIMFIFLALINNENDRKKFEILYILYCKKMFFTANNVLHDEHEAEDAVHNAFLSIANNIEMINDAYSNNTLSYVITIARNAAIDLSRQKKRIKYIDIDEDLHFDDTTDILDTITSEENFQSIVSIITNLPDTYRDVLYMHYVDSLSTREIASLFSKKESTIKKQVVRGKKLLVERIRKEGIVK